MRKDFSSLTIDGFQIEKKCRDDSSYVRFTDEDVEELTFYAFDMGYLLEPEVIGKDSNHPLRFKIISKANPSFYGWVSKVIEKAHDGWRDAYLYGFYKHGSFRNKYPITFNIESRMMRRMLQRMAEEKPRQNLYFRTMFGILDLEPESNTLEFILSWLSSCNFHRI